MGTLGALCNSCTYGCGRFLSPLYRFRNQYLFGKTQAIYAEMSAHHVQTDWLEGLHFEANIDGHRIPMDVPERVGGKNTGTIPKPLLLTALSGCTGMDVAAIVNRSASPFTSFRVSVDGDLTDRSPITYTAIRLQYTMEGAAEGRDRAINAVRKSIEQLCGVAFLLKKLVPMQWTLTYNGEVAYQGMSEPELLTTSSL